MVLRVSSLAAGCDFYACRVDWALGGELAGELSGELPREAEPAAGRVRVADVADVGGGGGGGGGADAGTGGGAAVVDPWSAVLPGPSLVPAYLASRYAAQYRVIVDALLEAQDTTLTGRSVQEVEEAVQARLVGAVGHRRAADLLAEPVFNLEARLGQLEKWDVVTRWQEPARTGEDFLRRRDRFQLTPLAARLHAFWLVADGPARRRRRNLGRCDARAACHPRSPVGVLDRCPAV